jgi:hypothetical protein
VDERENEAEARRMDDGKKEERVRDLEKGEVRSNDVVDDDDDDDVENVAHGHGHGHGHGGDHEEFNISRFHRLNPTNPLRIVINSSTRVAKPSPPTQSQRSHTHTRSIPTPQPIPAPIQTPQPPSSPPSPPQERVCFFFFLFSFFFHRSVLFILITF